MLKNPVKSNIHSTLIKLAVPIKPTQSYNKLRDNPPSNPEYS